MIHLIPYTKSALLVSKLLLSSVFLLAGQSLTAEAQASPLPCTENCPRQLAQAQPTTPANATVEPGSYTNHFFGFTMQFPDSWAIADQSTTQAVQDMGLDMIAGGDEAFRDMAEASLVQTYNLLTISPYPLGAPVESNPNLIVLAEPVSAFPGIQTGEDYMFHLRQMMEMGQMPYTIQRDPYPVDLGGQTFYRLDTTFDVYNISVRQSYLTTINSGFALTLILSGFEPDMEQLEAVAQSMQF